MATIATVYNRLLRPMAEAAGTAQVADNQYALRPIPNEDLYLFVKDFDNGRVVRQADPQASRDCWRIILSGGLAVLLLLGILLPHAMGMIAGYQIQNLRAEQQKLLADRAELDVTEAKLLSPQRINEFAAKQNFVDPAGKQYIVYLQSKSNGSVAMVKK